MPWPYIEVLDCMTLQVENEIQLGIDSEWGAPSDPMTHSGFTDGSGSKESLFLGNPLCTDGRYLYLVHCVEYDPTEVPSDVPTDPDIPAAPPMLPPTPSL
eukprot:TRINITY_DN108507_c0_g1_i1.p1 TRINITY_DN108507_c0_g1~~TRINITY_DN108507_c0_g1_i1.p1  ORF type:complete len:100 (-),score=2.15 TRINITY_DN108507_c0_g1_i1:70-369(-)